MKDELQNILDCMTGADGGGRFVKLRVLLEAMEAREKNGDAKAGEVLLVVKRFSKLIDIANS